MARYGRWLAGLALAAWAAPWAGPARAVDDGLGTNYVGVLRATGIELDGALRTAWPSEAFSVGGTFDFRANSNRVFWAPAFVGTGEMQTVRVQTDGGEADVRVVRSPWNAAWGTWDVVNDVKATDAGVADAVWASAWVSNAYRIGVVVTNFTTGTNLWWSVEGERTEGP
jgi:hypothetical protein